MLCDKCNKHPAAVHVERMVNNIRTEHNLCLHCAAEEGWDKSFDKSSDMSFEKIIKEFMGGLIGNFGSFVFLGHPGPGAAESIMLLENDMSCVHCGLSYTEFRDEGKLGCPGCYKAFRVHIDSILKSIHGSSEHVGKAPQKAPTALLLRREIETMRRQQNEAIENEDFETAAALRDKIRQAEALAGKDEG